MSWEAWADRYLGGPWRRFVCVYCGRKGRWPVGQRPSGWKPLGYGWRCDVCEAQTKEEAMTVARRVGHPRAKDVKVADVFGVTSPAGGGYDTAGNQPIQSPYTPAVVTPESVGITDPGSTLKFLWVADNGGIEDPTPQLNVIAAMSDRLGPDGPSFLLIGGDGVYFNGDPAQWPLQFYQPFAHFPLPIVMFPGNHDGDGTDGVAGSGLPSFLANMCTPTPTLPPGDPQDEYGRDTQTLPSHDWGITFEAATVLCVWSNVKSGGHLEPEQIAWLTEAVKNAPTDRPLFVGIHHPPYSTSADGGSSPELNAVLDSIWEASGRYPNIIHSGHVHDEQVFERTWPDGTTTIYGVSGNGGYHNTHPIAGDYTPGMQVADGVICKYADGDNFGFTEFTVSGGAITGEYVQVSKADGSVTPAAFTFTA